VKRVCDLCISSLALIVLWPVMVALAVAIKLADGGPVFYRGVRVGAGGVPFCIFKFRTMIVNADRLGGSSTANDDPRITRIGSKLRKAKLDELPQLLNVLRGDMSLVGPRPEVEEYVRLFSEEERAILTVKPGITDWATLENSDEGALLAGRTDAERVYLDEIRPQKLRLQIAYVRQRSLWVDLTILFRTLAIIVTRFVGTSVSGGPIRPRGPSRGH
jgi:lipopolysaccharide/colanic/teichoic acid biosynthesis glycosyltransferase